MTTRYDIQFVVCLSIYLFEWQGNIVVDSDIQQILSRNKRTTDPVQLLFPSDSCHDEPDQQEEHAITQEVDPANYTM